MSAAREFGAVCSVVTRSAEVKSFIERFRGPSPKPLQSPQQESLKYSWHLTIVQNKQNSDN